jgi:hypothetical protein
MTQNPRGNDLKEILVRIIREHGPALERLAESERIDRERFEQGLYSKYGWPEDDKNENDKTDTD